MQDKLLDVLNNTLKGVGLDAVETLNANADLSDDLQIDSITFAELIVNIDEAFGCNINAEGQVNTVGGILKQLEKQIPNNK